MKRIYITDGNVILYADLNDTVAANDFAKRLPCNINCSDSGIGYSCVTATGIYDPLETQTGWKNGDISIGGGCFALLYGGEDASQHSRNTMIIGRLDKKSLEQIHHLSDKVNLYISLA